VVHGTGVGVVARGAVGEDEDGARSRGGGAGARRVAVVRCGADDRVRPHARAAPAPVARRARRARVARPGNRRRRAGAVAGARIADAGIVALVGGRADDGVGAHAGAALAGVGLRAGVAVGTRDAIGLGRIGAGAGGGRADAGIVALVARGADHGVGA